MLSALALMITPLRFSSRLSLRLEGRTPPLPKARAFRVTLFPMLVRIEFCTTTVEAVAPTPTVPPPMAKLPATLQIPICASLAMAMLSPAETLPLSPISALIVDLEITTGMVPEIALPVVSVPAKVARMI